MNQTYKMTMDKRGRVTVEPTRLTRITLAAERVIAARADEAHAEIAKAANQAIRSMGQIWRWAK